MNHSSGFQLRLQSAWNDFFYSIRCCVHCLPCLQRRRQVYPSASNLVENRFITLHSQKLIRVIHMDYEAKISSIRESITGSIKLPSGTYSRNSSKILTSENDCSEYKRRSYSMISNTSEPSSEDYWFTHWSRPQKPADTCNCSFRTSWRSSFRDSKFSDIQNVLPEVKESLLSQQKKAGVSEDTLQGSVHSFADNLVEKIIGEVIDDLSSGIGRNEYSRTFNFLSTPCDKELKYHVEGIKFSTNSVVRDGQGCLNPSFIDHPSDPDSAVQTDSINVGNDNVKVNGIEILQSNISYSHNLRKNPSELRQYSSDSSAIQKIENGEFVSSVSQKTDELTSNSSGNIEPLLMENPPIITRTLQSKCHAKCSHSKNNKKLNPLIYFLHGAGCSADIWLQIMKHFAKSGFEVVAPDMLGHGYSSAPDSPTLYSFNNMLKDTIELFDKFVDEPRKCVVIGHAYGCSLAVALSRCRPQQVIQLVLISGGGPTPLAPHTADCKPISGSACLMACMQPLLKCGFRRNALYSTYGKHMVSCDVAGSGVPQYVLNYLAQGQDWAEGDAAFHRRITIPTLLVHGMQDPLVPLVHECEMERTIPRSFLEVIPNAGHFAMLETPDKLIHMIRCFIDWWNA